MVATTVTHMIIASNAFATSQATSNVCRSRVLTVQKYEQTSETKYIPQTDQAGLPQAGPQSYQYILVEPAISVGAGTIVRVKNAVRTISEPAKTISESLNKKVTRQLSQTTAITEGLVKVKAAPRTLSEPASAVSESLSKSATKVRTINEPANAISESLTTNKHFNRTISESAISVTDSLAKTAIKARQITEPPTNITETLLHLKTAELTESPLTITELLRSARTFSRTLEEVSFTSLSFTTPGPFANASFFDVTVPITERLLKKVTHNLAQTTTITENLSKVRIAVRTLSESVPLQSETIRRLVTHYLSQTVSISESLIRRKIISRAISEPPTDITDLLSARRDFHRQINPTSFTDASFATGAFESFNVPSGDVVEINEELEGGPLPPGVFNLIEPAIDITESLQATRNYIRTITENPVIIGESLTATKLLPSTISVGGVGGRRRRRTRPFFPTYRLQKPVVEPEPEHEPIIYQFELSEPPTPISEILTSTKIITKTKIETVSVAAAAPPPEIIEKEVEKIVYVDKIVEKEIQSPPIIKAQDIIASKLRPIETNQEILVSTQQHSNKMKSKAASAQLQTLEQLMALAEMEEMI